MPSTFWYGQKIGKVFRVENGSGGVFGDGHAGPGFALVYGRQTRENPGEPSDEDDVGNAVPVGWLGIRFTVGLPH